MRIHRSGGTSLVLAMLTAAGFALPALAQSAPAVPPAPAASPGPAPSREALQQQLEAQNAKNEQLRQRIAKLEEVLKTDVCNNPEAEALLKTEQQAAPH